MCGAAAPARAQIAGAPSSHGHETEPFAGHAGLTVGAGVAVQVPLGAVAKGPESSFQRSHLGGAGLDLHAGVLFRRQWGVFAHGAFIEHLPGTSKPESATSTQLGASIRYLLRPERRTFYVEAGVDRDAFKTTVQGATGSDERSAASWDLRLGAGYLALGASDRLLITPFAALDLGRFSSVSTKTAAGASASLDLPSDERAWHFVAQAGVLVAFHAPEAWLLGPVPARADDRPLANPPVAAVAAPPADADADGVLDDADRCPDAKEDGLAPEPNDGCPTTDRDHDGVADEADKCPDEPETVNGVDDADGCPDEGRVQVAGAAITISEMIYFASGKAEIGPTSTKLLDEIAATLEGRPDVRLVEIQGHADFSGRASENVKLTQARADAVRAALVQRGVDPSRLTSVGYGHHCPIDPALWGRGLDRNRRVELRIVRTSEGPTNVETACKAAAEHHIDGTAPDAKGGTP